MSTVIKPEDVRIGVQAMMLKGEVAEHGIIPTFTRLSDEGYRIAEISQIPMTAENLADLRRVADDAGIRYCAISANLEPSGANDSFEREYDKIVADAHALGADMIRIGMLPAAALRSIETLTAFCTAAEEVSHRLADEGIALYYHNHHIEFARMDGEFVLDRIAELSPSVGFELDAHWIQRGGLDPARVIAKYAGRVRMIHLKDYRIGLPSHEALDAHAAENWPVWDQAWHGAVQFAEVGEGNLDWPGIIAQSAASGAQYLLVEQDELYGRTVWEALATSRENLVGLGYGDLF